MPDQPEPTGELRPDAARTIARLERTIGAQAGQLARMEDVIEQLQEQLAEATAQAARAELRPAKGAA